jgi:Ca2+-transporting ATPase
MPEAHDPPGPAGLSQDEAAAILARNGPNELAGGGHRSLLFAVRDVLSEPMLLLLLAAGAIYFLLGDFRDAAVLSGFAGLTIVIAIVQEGRTDRAIEALRDLTMPMVLVIRDGERRQVPSREVVRGDIVVLSEGDRIPADGWLPEAEGLQADESILTGESVPTSKRACIAGDPDLPPLPGGDGLPFVFAGTLVVRGNGILEVSATGPRTRMGAIGQSLATLETESPRLKRQTRRLVRLFAFFGIGVSLLATALFGLLRGGWLEAVLAGIALGMSMLPEELPVVLTLFMTMGALRMSRNRVLARRGAAIESLGAATVLCTDKTGTLTQNRMEIAELRLPDGQSLAIGGAGKLTPAGDFVDLAALGILACLEQPFDPMETAFHDLEARHGDAGLDRRRDEGLMLRKQYGFGTEMLAMSQIWSRDGDSEHVVATKGAPEAIADLCGLAGPERAALDAAVEAMASRGLRVLGVAEARWQGNDFPASQRAFAFAFRGLVGLADPLRESVPDAVRQLQDAGVRVVMITGDYPATAGAIAARAGIAGGALMSGQDLAALDDAALAARIVEVAVFARVLPEQKLRIVQALKSAGAIVAMTGDGVNDAPSLKAAHIGIAMGRRGTDVAREAAAIVLLDDDFGSIPVAVRLGRRIYDNLRKAMGFIFAVHIPIAGLALAPLLFGWPIILGPMHIALLEMIIDPVCSLAFEAEPEEDDIMRRPPRDPDGALFPRRLLAWAVLQGSVSLAMLLGLTLWAMDHAGGSIEEMRSIVFAGLMAAVLVLVAINRAFRVSGSLSRARRNLPLVVIVGLAVLASVLMFEVPMVAGLFGFTMLDGAGLVAVAILTLGLLATLGLFKRPLRDMLVR